MKTTVERKFTVKQVTYFWYHHGMLTDERDWICKKFVEGDYEFFKFLKKTFDSDDSPFKMSYDGKPMTYFPDTVIIEFSDGSFISQKLTKETFKLITYSECENG